MKHNEVKLFVFFVLLFMNCECLERAGSSSLVEFHDALRSNKHISTPVVERAACELVEALQETVMFVPHEVYAHHEEEDFYLDEETIRQSNFLTLTDELKIVRDRMANGPKKEAVTKVINKFETGDGDAHLIDLCQEVRGAL